MRRLFESSSDCVARFDSNGRLLFLSPGTPPTDSPLQHLVCAVDQLGRDLAENATQKDLIERLIRRVFQEGTAQSVEAQWSTADGIRDFDLRLIPERAENGTIASVLAISHDITERKRKDRINVARLHLIHYAAAHSLHEFLEETLNQIEILTGSRIGFYHSINDDQKTLTLQTWSSRTKADFCTATGSGMHYPILEAGVWVDCFYARQPVIHNDYASLPHRKGLPEGHADVIRELIVPVVRNRKVKAIFGVGNKETVYTEKDVEIASLLADLTWEIAENKQSEDVLRRINRELHAISECNQTLLRASDEKSLHERICKIVCEEAGYRMAWVGYAEQDEAKTVRVVAWAGAEQGYLNGVNITWADTERGRGPTGRAIRTGRSVYLQDFTTAPDIAPWRDRALSCGYRSSIALPLKGEDASVLGALTIYSGEPNAFTADELRLLEELAGDLAYGITALRTRAQRKSAEEEREKLKVDLQQVQKMEAVGQLAGGIAHDFNNILAVVNGYSEVLLSDEKLSAEDRAWVQAVLDAGKRGATLTSQLLAFSRRQVLQPRVLDVNRVINDVRDMVSRLIGEEIELKLELESDLNTVTADPMQLEQVILNLCINARDAMPDGGTITISTASVEIDDASKEIYFPMKTGRYVRLVVTDTGVGMDKDVLSHVFEPFFTTKAPDQGTGLGLATVYGIVNQSGGHVSVESEPGKGAAFSVYLPVGARKIEAKRQELGLGENVRGTGTILLAEDIAPVRALTRQFLESCGYSVLEVEDGEKAMKVGADPASNISLLLTDVGLPKIKGPCLARNLREKRPDLKVLYVSGYADSTVVHNGVLEPGTAFLQKPFSSEALTKKVRELLTGT